MSTSLHETPFEIKDQLLLPSFEGYQLIFDDQTLPYRLAREWPIQGGSQSDRTEDAPLGEQHLKKVLKDRYHVNRLSCVDDQGLLFFTNSSGDVMLLNTAETETGVSGKALQCVFRGSDFMHDYNRYNEREYRQLVWPEEPTVAACSVRDDGGGGSGGTNLLLVLADGKGEVNILQRDKEGKCFVVGQFVNVITDAITKVMSSEGMTSCNEKLMDVERGFPCRVLDCSFDNAERVLRVALVSCVDLDKFADIPESIVTSGSSHDTAMQQARKKQQRVRFFVHTLSLAVKDGYDVDRDERWQVTQDNCVVGLQPVTDSWFDASQLVILSEDIFQAPPLRKDVLDEDVEMEDFQTGSDSMKDEDEDGGNEESGRKRDYVAQVNERLAPYTANLDEESILDMIETGEDVEARQFYMTGVCFTAIDSDDLAVTTLCCSHSRQLLATSKKHRAIGIRHGYDMCAYVFDAKTGDCEHVCNFHALAYILESKQQKRFVEFDIEAGTSFVVDHQDRIYIYFSKQVDQRTRKAPHQIVNLRDGGQTLGFALLPNHDLYVLNNSKLYHYKFHS